MPSPNPFRKDAVSSARKALDDAARALANAEARREKAAADVAAAERAQDVAATADGEAAVGVLESATRQVRDARDLLTAFDDRVIPAARAAVTAAEAAVADAERTATYDRAIAQRKVAAARLAKEYTPAITTLAELKAIVADADRAIDEANANLPAGRDALDTVEGTVRDIPAQPRKVISDRVEPIWHHASGDRVQDPSRVQGGVYRYGLGPQVHQLGADHCKRIDKRVVTYTPAQPAIPGARLADTPLPPLKPDAVGAPDPITEYLQPETADQRVVA